MVHRRKIAKYRPNLQQTHAAHSDSIPKGLSKLPKLNETLQELCSTSCALFPRPREGKERYERKIIVIDGANFLYQSSSNEDDLTVLGLFSLMRMLIKYDFEVEVYFQEVYWKKHITYGIDSLRELVTERIVFPVPGDEYDDDYYFKIAERLGGTVLSNDYFRNEMAARGHDEVYIKSYSTTVTCLDPPPNKQMCMTSDGHFIARHLFLFSPLDGQFFAHHEDGLIYAISKDRNARRNPIAWNERKIRILEVLDNEIARVIDDEKKKRHSSYTDKLNYHLKADGVYFSGGEEEDRLEFEMPEGTDEEKRLQDAVAMEFLAEAANDKRQRRVRWQEIDSDEEEEYTQGGLRIEKEKALYVPYCLPRINPATLKQNEGIETIGDNILELNITDREAGNSLH